MKRTLILLSLACGMGAIGCKQGYKTTPGGLQYRILDDEKGPAPKEGDYLKLQIKTTVGDTVLRDTHDEGPVRLPFQQPQSHFDLMEGLSLLSAGDSAEFVIPADSVMTEMQRPPFIKKGDKLHVTVKVLAIQNMEQMQADIQQEKTAQLAKDSVKIQQYISSNNLQATKTEQGVYVIVKQPGSGSQVQPGQTVKVDYTGKSLEGKPFDSSTDSTAQSQPHPLEPLQFTVGSGQMIRGFDDGILQLKKGAEATLIIPSSLAWGSTGRPPVIEPDEIVVFDIHVLDVSGKSSGQ